MVFTDPRFLFFFLPLVLIVYTISPRTLKNVVLVAASIWFYAWGEGWATLIVLFSILFNFIWGIVLDAARGDGRGSRGKGVLALGVALNLLLLVNYKYADFLTENLNALLRLLHIPTLDMPHRRLPIGISFYTFHALSYLIDIHRREVKAMRSLMSFSLYIMLFPQLIAGPIIRYKTIYEQFAVARRGEDRGRRMSWEAFAEGVRRFVIGLGKKMLIANIVGEAADQIFAVPLAAVTPGTAWLGIVCYTLQIYFDFSGYSDMAIGLARMLGFTFPENFNYPYVAKSVTEFWRRWHISLSSWFRDYLYIPLGGNRVAKWRVYFNLLTVFFLCGLWHGATWTFVVWGMYHGAFLIFERSLPGKWLETRWNWIRHSYLLIVVMFGWVFFRASSIQHAGRYFSRLFFMPGSDPLPVPAGIYLDSQLMFALIAGIIGSIPWMPMVRDVWTTRAKQRPGLLVGRTLEAGWMGVVFVLSCGAAASSTFNPFIYFRF